MSDTPEVYLDVDRVTNMAKTLGTVSEVLTTVSTVLEVISDTLKASFFLGFVGMAAVGLIESVRPQIKQVADRCSSLSEAVTNSVQAYNDKDMKASNNFMTSRLS